MSDALKKAKFHLEATQDCLDLIGDLDAGHRAQAGQLAALIAIAERMAPQANSDSLTAIQTLAIEALCTDGGHHKQWYLEKILAHITKADTFEVCKAAYEWEPGIAP